MAYNRNDPYTPNYLSRKQIWDLRTYLLDSIIFNKNCIIGTTSYKLLVYNIANRILSVVNNDNEIYESYDTNLTKSFSVEYIENDYTKQKEIRLMLQLGNSSNLPRIRYYFSLNGTLLKRSNESLVFNYNTNTVRDNIIKEIIPFDGFQLKVNEDSKSIDKFRLLKYGDSFSTSSQNIYLESFNIKNKIERLIRFTENYYLLSNWQFDEVGIDYFGDTNYEFSVVIEGLFMEYNDLYPSHSFAISNYYRGGFLPSGAVLYIAPIIYNPTGNTVKTIFNSGTNTFEVSHTVYGEFYNEISRFIFTFKKTGSSIVKKIYINDRLIDSSTSSTGGIDSSVKDHQLKVNYLDNTDLNGYADARIKSIKWFNLELTQDLINRYFAGS
jgi:hypothetical protein